MKVGIDSYCYHRFFGEVYPDQKPPAKNMTMEDFLARAKELEGQVAQPARQQQRHLSERVSQLEQENASLRERLDAATARTSQMLDRVRFIRQQAQGGSDR